MKICSLVHSRFCRYFWFHSCDSWFDVLFGIMPGSKWVPVFIDYFVDIFRIHARDSWLIHYLGLKLPEAVLFANLLIFLFFPIEACNL